jgi:hypothetical protein
VKQGSDSTEVYIEGRKVELNLVEREHGMNVTMMSLSSSRAQPGICM